VPDTSVPAAAPRSSPAGPPPAGSGAALLLVLSPDDGRDSHRQCHTDREDAQGDPGAYDHKCSPLRRRLVAAVRKLNRRSTSAEPGRRIVCRFGAPPSHDPRRHAQRRHYYRCAARRIAGSSCRHAQRCGTKTACISMRDAERMHSWIGETVTRVLHAVKRCINMQNLLNSSGVRPEIHQAGALTAEPPAG
jgi:hypothetical protein